MIKDIIEKIDERINSFSYQFTYTEKVPGIKLVNVELLKDIKDILNNSINKADLIKWLTGIKESSNSESVINLYEIIIDDIENKYQDS